MRGEAEIALIVDGLEAVFVRKATEKLRRHRVTILFCLDELHVSQIWWRPHDEANSIGNLVLHLCGNLRQWMISGVGGAPDVRDRPAEFSASGPLPTEELVARLRATVDEALAVLDRLEPESLCQPLVVQGYEETAAGAIYETVEHFAEHTAQIALMTKLILRRALGFYDETGHPTEVRLKADAAGE